MCSPSSCGTERLVPDVASTTLLSGGTAIPCIGLGTGPMDDTEAERAVVDAVEAGYRLFDTAENYRNERGVGRGLRASGLPRKQLFVTTKFNREWHGVRPERRPARRGLHRPAAHSLAEPLP